MAQSNVFASRSDDDVLRLIVEQPLAWVTSGGGDSFRATLLPLRPVQAGDGRITSLIGHFARSNSQVELLKVDPRAVILALGPHGYISPSWMADRTQAPTWNYTSAQFLVDIEFFDGEQELRAHLDDLVGAMEAGREKPWGVAEMAGRYATLARRIIGFRANVRTVRAKFKLGQDERDDVLRDITKGLGRVGDNQELLTWMRHFNAERSG